MCEIGKCMWTSGSRFLQPQQCPAPTRTSESDALSLFEIVGIRDRKAMVSNQYHTEWCGLERSTTRKMELAAVALSTQKDVFRFSGRRDPFQTPPATSSSQNRSRNKYHATKDAKNQHICTSALPVSLFSPSQVSPLLALNATNWLSRPHPALRMKPTLSKVKLSMPLKPILLVPTH